MAKKQCNILILGETGVGKSTFINAFANYINFPTLNDALEAENIQALIPSKFTITDSNFISHEISFGEDKNESFQTGESSTQFCRTYSFETDDIIIRLIDTPGIGDTRGVQKDQENFENLLVYLGEFKEVNAIIIMLKPNESRVTILFNYCIKQLLSSLERSAVDNILFLFTNARATFYNPGDTIGPLRAVLKEIKDTPPNVSVPFGAENTFCLDNEAFRYLLATRKGVSFAEWTKPSYQISWDTSVAVSKRLLQYVVNLKPHSIQNTVSVMDARRTIERLRKPLGEITILIEDNINRMDRLKENLSDTTKSIEELRKYLYVDRINLKVVNFKNPRTVCAHENCTESYKVNDSTSIHYKTLCHNPCYLSGIPRNILGDYRLQDCAAMTTRNRIATCKYCGHEYLKHMHIYYTTEPYEEKNKDEKVEKDITSKQQKEDEIKKELERIESIKKEYEKEREIIQKAVAKFAHFLSNSVIIPYNDAYKEYILYLMDKEKKLGEFAKQHVIKNYENIIKTYEMEKATLMEELKKVQSVKSDVKTIVTASEVMNIIKELYKLKYTGNTIKEMYEAQQRHAVAEIVRETETVVKPIPISKRGNIFSDIGKFLIGSLSPSGKNKSTTTTKTTKTVISSDDGQKKSKAVVQ